MVAMIVIGFSAMAITQGVVQGYQQQKQQHVVEQLHWLAEAGAQRALAQRRQKPDYRQETWKITAAELKHTRSATIEIQLETILDKPEVERLRVLAHFEEEQKTGPRIQRQWIVSKVTSQP